MADTETQEEKRGRGRPSKYPKDACARIIGYGREGMCVAEMANEFDVSIQSLYEWSGVHEDFSEAFRRAQEAAEGYWAKSVREGLKKAPSEFQGPANLKYMAQRFKGWSEKAHVDTREVVDESDTPDIRKDAREVAFLLSRAAKGK